MALKVKDPGTARDKFINRGAAAAPDYTNGVKGAGNSWQQNTAASADNYSAGVTDAISRGAFQKGVQQAGGAKYEQRASTVGAQRYPQGIRDAGPAWEAGTTPYLQTLSALNLPPRRPKGDPSNWQRAQVVGEALRRRKVGG
jgi:hypothetical protein